MILMYYNFNTIIMNKYTLTNYEISLAVKHALKQKQWSVRTCCAKYNELHESLNNRNNTGKIFMEKDFVQRIKNNQFNVVSKRVAALCNFLGIDLENGNICNQITSIREDFLKFEKAIVKNPLLEAKARKLLRNIIDIISFEEKV